MKKNDLLPLIEVEAENFARIAARIRGRTRNLVSIEERTEEIIGEVRRGGDAALRRYSVELEKVDIGKRIMVGSAEAKQAFERVDAKLLDALQFSLSRIRKTQAQLLQRLSFSYVANGFVLRYVPKPLSSVGCYVPGGRAAYASTVLMTAGVAKLAGVKRVVVCTPPSGEGKISDSILAAANLCGVDEVYRVGGAHSIAAMAYGTESIAKVRKVVGPGGTYVSMAKKMVSRDVPVDFFAGPTELVVLGDGTTDPRLAAWDLVGQAEHGEDSLCGLVTWDEGLAKDVRKEVEKISSDAERRGFVRGALSGGFAALCSDRKTALDLVNALAPEHLELLVSDARGLSKEVENAGLILAGEYSPCAASDYCIGTDHVIPTQGYAEVRAGLSVLDFVKLNCVVEGTRQGLRSVLPAIKSLANAEGLPNHYKSVESRFTRK